MQFIGGILTTVIVGPIGWVLFSFVGTPIRRFWDLRGQVAHAMNAYARNISGPPSNDFLLLVTVMGVANSKVESAKEFRRLGLEILSFWQNETLARLLLRSVSIHGDAAARILIELADANIATDRLGPRRSELAATLRLKV